MNTLKEKTFLLSFLLLFSAFTIPLTAQSLNSFFDRTGAFMKAHVKNGKVDYAAIKKSPEKLKKLVNQIQNISLEEATSSQKKAFYINAYNLLTINSIIQHGIPSSPMDIDGFFDSITHQVAGEKLSLDELETKRLRKVYNDPRIHFSIVCGALSCPPIRPFAYQPERLDEQLTSVTRSTLNSDFLRVNSSDKTAQISEIFKWYKQDFLDKNDSILAFVNQYRKDEIPASYSIDYYDYDWSLNSQ